MTDTSDYKARCSFYVRIPVPNVGLIPATELASIRPDREGMQYRYDHARTRAQHPGTDLVTLFPPRIGEMIDLVVLNPRDEEVSYPCRVVDIGHTYPAIGSVSWNRGEVGPRLDIICERSGEFLFTNEAPLDD